MVHLIVCGLDCSIAAIVRACMVLVAIINKSPEKTKARQGKAPSSSILRLPIK